MNLLKKGTIFTIIKYLFSFYITCLSVLTKRDMRFIIVGLIELMIIFLISNYVSEKNKILGYLINVVLLFLYNVQIICLYFASSFVTIVMLDNIGFLHDLHGKTYEYLRLIVPMIIFTFIPIRHVNVRKNVMTCSVVGVVLAEIVVMSMYREYSPGMSLIQLIRARYDYNRINTVNMSDGEVKGDKSLFYNDAIESGIEKPNALGEKPNIVMIFVEGFSKNIIEDERNIVPNINEMASTSLEFKNYYNHTFATLRGLIGQLYSGYQLDNMDNNTLVSLQGILGDYGYKTTFINTEPGNAPFTQYLSNLQFNELITDNTIFDEKAGYIHDKEALEFLYNVIEQQCQSDVPFFTAIYTFGTHVSLDSPDEVFEDGTDPLLNKFYNMDFQLGQFISKFKENDALDNTILVITTDHATYGDDDFVRAFPNYKRINTEIDEIPLYIYHKGITHQVIDVNGRNSLDMASTLLDYIDISERNYFLGTSLFCARDSKRFNCDNLFYDSYYYLSSANSEIKKLAKEEYLDFNDLLMNYFSVKGSGDSLNEFNNNYIDVKVSADEKTITIMFEGDGDYKNIWFPVWSDINDQDDLKFYCAEKGKGDVWTYTVKLSDHNNDKGSYSIHVYTGETEPVEFIGAGTAYVE